MVADTPQLELKYKKGKTPRVIANGRLSWVLLSRKHHSDHQNNHRTKPEKTLLGVMKFHGTVAVRHITRPST